MRDYFNLTKMGIVLFVVLTGVAGYAISHPLGSAIDFSQVLFLMAGLYLVSAGSFILNQAQEWRRDIKMPRTKKRPIVRGIISPWQAYVLGVLFCLLGVGLLYLIKPLTAAIAVATVILYNVFYTMFWKRRWAFGAVPGAIPGALPVMIGYSVNSDAIFGAESMYLFMVMFLWQMPHFWALAIRFRDDYAAGGFPVLPVKIGVSRTLYHIGLYVFAYVGLALAQPWFFKAHVLYVLLVVPLALKVVYEFFRYFNAKAEKAWLSFFLWTNLSVLVFLGVPVFDKWLFYGLLSNF